MTLASARKVLVRVLVFAALACTVRLCSAESEGDEAPYGLPVLEFRAPDASMASHRKFGEAMGSRFAEGIRLRLQQWVALQEHLLPALQTTSGRRAYDGFLQVHTSTFPEYVEELQGMAQGAGLPFEWLFVAQIEEEFNAQVPQLADIRGLLPETHCSDYMLCSAARCVGGHNEDNNANSIKRAFAVDAQFGDHRFQAYVYMGELPSGGFGVNSRGVGFSLNWVGPPPAKAPGLARGFISRFVLDAGTMEEALLRATRKGQAGGHNYQLFDFCGRSILNVETAQDSHSALAIGSTPFFHANQYQTLAVPGETFGNSSVHRRARIAKLPVPHTLADIQDILGDQGDWSYPVFHDNLSHVRGELSDWTLATAMFDLDNRTVTILRGNPAAKRVWSVWNVSSLLSASGCEREPLVVMM